MNLQADCHGVQHWLRRGKVLRVTWTDDGCMLLALAALVINDAALQVGFAVPELTYVWAPGERAQGLLTMGHLWVRKAQRADAEEGCGIQRPWLSGITVLSCSLWAECALAIDFASLSKISVSCTKSMGDVPLFCFNLSRRALHLIADQWIWLLPVS